MRGNQAVKYIVEDAHWTTVNIVVPGRGPGSVSGGGPAVNVAIYAFLVLASRWSWKRRARALGVTVPLLLVANVLVLLVFVQLYWIKPLFANTAGFCVSAILPIAVFVLQSDLLRGPSTR